VVDVMVVPAAQELATWAETNDRWPVSGQLANGQVSSMSSGQTKGDLTHWLDRRVARARWPYCPVTVDLPFCQWILLVRHVLPP